MGASTRTAVERPENRAVATAGEITRIQDELKSVDQRINAASMSTEITPVSAVTEREPEWLVTNYVPRGGLTVLAGTGGEGKTTIWCSIAAAISTGRQTFLEEAAGIPFNERKPEKVLCFSSEDSFACVLKRRLRVNGADLDNIYHIPISDDRFRDVFFDSEFLKALIAANKPSLVIFDPIQGFVPPNVHMGDRNAMRSCLEPLIAYGEQYGTTFLIVVHTNKRSGAYGRDRMADSADVWDIARSVLMAGVTDDDGIRYISQEKNNYATPEMTVLYCIEDEIIVQKGSSLKKDRDFVEEKLIQKSETRSTPARDDAKDFILDYLANGEVEVSDLNAAAKAMSICSVATLKRAKAELKQDGLINYRKHSGGKGSGVKWFICSTEAGDTPREM